MGNERVWVSRAFVDSTLITGFVSEESYGGSEKIFSTTSKNDRGAPFPPEAFPKMLHGRYPDRKIKKLLDVMHAGPWLVVSQAVADIFRQFDMGQGNLYPVTLMEYDQQTQFEGNWYHLNVGNVKNTYLSDQSNTRKHILKPGEAKRPDRFSARKDLVLALRETTLNGPDIWMEEDLPYALFISDPLVQALKDAKLARVFNLRECKIVRDH